MSEVLDSLSRLVAFPTVSHRPTTEIAAWLAQRAEDAGFSVRHFATSEHKANVVATLGPDGTDGLLISGHMDVVPVDGQDWSSDPFALTERDGRLHGRGACDMKGFIAAVVEACVGLPALQRQLMLVWTHDEEIGCVGSEHLVDAWEGPVPSQTWIGEPTSLRVCRMHAGHTTLRLRLRGEPAHSSRPQLGRSAVWALGHVLAELERIARDWRDQPRFEALLDSPYTVVNPGLISGGSAINIIPEHAELQVGFRFLPGEDSSVRIDEVMARLRALDLDVELAGEVLQDARPLLTEENTPLMGLLGAQAQVGAVPFATDGGNLARLGTAPVVFGPGSIDVAHKPDEYIDPHEILETVALAGRVIRARCCDAP